MVPLHEDTASSHLSNGLNTLLQYHQILTTVNNINNNNFNTFKDNHHGLTSPGTVGSSDPWSVIQHNFLWNSVQVFQLILWISLSKGLDHLNNYSPVEIRDVKLPLYGVYGGTAMLQCQYSSVIPVYSVKWYKNGKEFYRWWITVIRTLY